MCGGIAQLVRVPARQAGSHWFDPDCPYQFTFEADEILGLTLEVESFDLLVERVKVAA